MFFRIINVNLTSVQSNEPESEVKCGSCTLCCEKLAPYLTPEEASSGLYPLSLIEPSREMIELNPEVGPIVTLYRKKDGGCGMFVDGKCTIYEHRPFACRQFDCSKGHHPNIPNMVSL